MNDLRRLSGFSILSLLLVACGADDSGTVTDPSSDVANAAAEADGDEGDVVDDADALFDGSEAEDTGEPVDGESLGTNTQALTVGNFSLQLPTGSGNSPTTISASSLANGYSSYFYKKASDGGQLFIVPPKGITTSGSKHTRTEMRENTASGGQAAWSAWATNTITVTGKVLKVGGGSSGTTAVGQVFNGSDSIPLCELMYSNSKKGFILLYEEAKGGGTTYNLNTPVALGATYTYTLALTNGVLSVTINGKKVYSRTPSSKIQNKKFYFKFGNYDQTTSAGSPSNSTYTSVQVNSVKVVHK